MREDTSSEKVNKKGRFQRGLWKFYTDHINELKPIDILIVNGDAIEGKNETSGGIELITSDRNEQVKMAKAAIDFVEAKKIRILYGTRRHVGKEEDFEATLVDMVTGDDIKIEGHAFLNVNGRTIDIKHKVTSSTIPHGRTTSIARARFWNVIWNSDDFRQPKADILIRSHVHYFQHIGGSSWLGIITPALCYNSHYGIRECEGLVDVGMIVIDFDEEGEYSWRTILAKFKDLRVLPEAL
jgi:hypothetical protein